MDEINGLVNIIEPIIKNETCLLEILEIIKNFSFNLSGDFSKNDRKFLKQKIYQSKFFEIFLIFWPKDYCKDYHKHPNNGCILKVLSGQLLEIIKKNENDLVEYHYLRDKGSTSYIDNYKGTHKIIALEDSLSIHIYSPPGFYDK
jgi:hypothetical protein